MISNIKSVVLLFILTATVFCNICCKTQDSLPDLVATTSPAIVTVQVYGTRFPKYGHISDPKSVLLKTGTGFFINSTKEIITNYHVIQMDDDKKPLEIPREIRIKTSDGKEYAISGVVAFNKSSDLVQVTTEMPINSANHLVLADTLPRVGEQVTVIGSPLGLEQTVSNGIISAIREISNGSKMLQMTVPISPGSSGSPVLNQQGKVVGVANSGIIKGQNINFAIPLDEIKNLSVSKAIPFDEWELRESKKENLDRFGMHFKRARELSVEVSKAKELSVQNYKEAFIEYELAIEANKNNSDTCSHIYECIGRDYSYLKQFEKAIGAYQLAIKLKPTVDAYTALASVYRSMAFNMSLTIAHSPSDKAEEIHQACNLFEERAVDVYMEAIKQYPSESELYTELGSTYIDLYQYDKAFQILEIAKKIDPGNVIAQRLYGETCLKLDYIDSAIAEYEGLNVLDGGITSKGWTVKELAESLLLSMKTEVAKRKYENEVFGTPFPKNTKKLLDFLNKH